MFQCSHIHLLLDQQAENLQSIRIGDGLEKLAHVQRYVRQFNRIHGLYVFPDAPTVVKDGQLFPQTTTTIQLADDVP